MIKRRTRAAILGLLLGCSLPVWSAVQPADSLYLLPQPKSVEMRTGVFRLNEVKKGSIQAPDSIAALIADYLPEGMKATTKSRKATRMEIRLTTGQKEDQTDESYVLDITDRKISIEAASVAGVFYALQTLGQLTDKEQATVPAVRITDEPRFAYRGIMLDVSRHFFDADFLKRQIDVLAAFKINRLHLHLTDAAGWRLQIDRYPRLTELAAWRPQRLWKEWWKGARRYVMEGTPNAYGGYYTKEEIRDLVDYARKRQITIIPEIEMPSHSEEVLTAYPELSCTHELYKPSDFCVGNEKTFEFLEQVLTEVMELFPSEYIHIGGDEAPKTDWRTCPRCQKRIKDEGLKDEKGLQSYLVHRIEKFLNAHGRKLLGWDEILEGGLAPNATVMSWRGTEGGIEAVKSGHQAIMTPGQYCYLDGYQDAPHTQPEAIGGYLPLSKVYSYDPVPQELTSQEQQLIIGVQGNLWAEYVPTEEHAEYMLYPRALAIAETGWTQPENKSWKRFHHKAVQVTKDLREAGYQAFPLEREFGNRPGAGEVLKHKAWNKPVTYNARYWGTYPAGGDKALTDGLRGGWNYNDGFWQGFVSQKRLDVTIDLGSLTDIQHIQADFMQICGPEVYLPAHVIISISEDGKEFTQLKEIKHKPVRNDEVTFKTYGWEGTAKTRFIRYQALAGDEFGGVVFTDEIVVE